MNLNQLEYFVSAAEHLNFTKAAAQCFISQTAMTQQIQALEKTVGVPLFVRDKHHVALTPAGKVFLTEAKKIISRSDEALKRARLASEGADGEITIGFISGFGQSDAPAILNGFHSAYPNIKIKLLRDTLSGLMNALEKGKCDVAFSLTSSQFQKQYSDISHRYLMSYPLMAVLPKGHRLEEKEMISYEDLRDENFLIMQPSARSRDETEEIFIIYERGGFIPNVVALEQEPESLILMVSIGMGITLLPEYIIRHYHGSENISIRPMVRDGVQAETLDFELSWSSGNLNPAVEKLLSWSEALRS